MTTQVVHFKGKLEQFGKTFTVSVDKTADIFSLLDCQISGFRAFLIRAFEAGLDLAIISKDNLTIEEPEELFLINKKPNEYYISLVPTGSGFLGKLLAAVLLFAAAFLPGVGFATAIALKAAAALTAIAAIVDLLTKPPKTKEEEEGPGIFDGPENTIKSGQPVPILYGELLVGGAPIHVDISSAEVKGRLPTNPNTSNSNLQTIVTPFGTITIPIGGAIGAGATSAPNNRVKNYR